jgi:uncharacterized membrane protein (GlpM family)
MMDLLIRFLVGGAVVSVFAMLGDVLRPKSFAGLFSAAPSIALATVTLAIRKSSKVYAAHEAASMLLGAVAFIFYATAVSFVLRRCKLSALVTASILMPIWLGVALGLWAVLGGRL